MDEEAPEIQDLETFGSDTCHEVVRAGEGDDRDWISEAPICELLKIPHISHVGRMWAKPPFTVIRAKASGTFALVGLEGSGETLIDGDWREVKAGEICLLPAFAHTGIRAANEEVWKFAWVRYEEDRGTSSILSTESPVIQSGSVLPMEHAVAGLSAEMEDASPDPARLHHWVELIHGFVVRAARPFQGDDRLSRVWREVEADPARDWTLGDLSQVAHLSQEHLRRLTKRQLGRSPVQQVTYLRMRHAVSLLSTTDDKVESVARAVGYENPFTFSNAFKRWTGKRPSEFRE